MVEGDNFEKYLENIVGLNSSPSLVVDSYSVEQFCLVIFYQEQ